MPSTATATSCRSAWYCSPASLFLSAYEGMRDQAERFVVLPFSIGCTSESSVALGTSQPKKPKADQSNPPLTRRQEGEERSSSRGKMKNSFSFLALPKPNIGGGIQRVIRSIKSFSQLFVYKEEIGEMEKEMEIGYPTDVKHVTHIGLGGSSTTNSTVKGWENLKAPEILSFPTISLRQFELAMAEQAHEPLVVDLQSVVKE